eukprot:CAMPEP_0184713072 /NCGR_PEP_ID=MMETSP0314-20130426/3501_1 /TAXON_ID=38298 /ORGANISM="Rhodella maculata, Strain CCMP 736" /LENGTH=89 /DNA_ID=CAMNT_0027175639 /DNA_START=40 /DNA_END=309 /DNA_ORIENTATION=-
MMNKGAVISLSVTAVFAAAAGALVFVAKRDLPEQKELVEMDDDDSLVLLSRAYTEFKPIVPEIFRMIGNQMGTKHVGPAVLEIYDSLMV